MLYLLYHVILQLSYWRRKWQPTPVLLPGKSHGLKSLVGYSPWGCKESGTTKRLHFTHFILNHWRRKWQPTPVFSPGESHGQRSLEGHGPWGSRELDTAEVTKHACTTILYYIIPLEKEMALYCSILALEIPRSEEPGGLQSMGLQRID